MKAEENRAFVGSKMDGMQSALENLPNVQQVDENQAILTSKVDGVQSTLYGMVENAKEVYSPVIKRPCSQPYRSTGLWECVYS